MTGALDISYLSLGLCFLLFTVPFIISRTMKLGLIRQTVFAVIRMTVQLALIAVFLEFIFDLDNPFLSAGWFLVMVLSATITAISKSNLSLKLLIFPALVSLTAVSFGVTLYFNALVVNLANIMEAKYFIAIGGMVLGNSLRGIIVGLDTFYAGIKRNEDRYLYRLGSGATFMEGIIPYYRKSLSAAIAPTVAVMATMGIVSLPGMMTGQILGGSSPLVAVKYQIAIMVAIFVSVTASISITILMTVRFCFDELGVLKIGVFRKKK